MKIKIGLAVIILAFTVGVTTACDFASQYSWGNLILPIVDFRETSLSNVCVVLNEFISKAVTNFPSPTIRVEPDAKGPITTNSPFAPPGGSTPTDGIPLINFNGKYLRIGCMLRLFANLEGLVCKADENGAVFKTVTPEKAEGITNQGSVPAVPSAAR